MRELPGVGDVLDASVFNVRQGGRTFAFSVLCPQCTKSIRFVSKTQTTVDAVAAGKRCEGCGSRWETVPGTHKPAHDGWNELIKVRATDTPFGRRRTRTQGP